MKKSDKELRRSKQGSNSTRKDKLLSGTQISSHYTFDDDTHNINTENIEDKPISPLNGHQMIRSYLNQWKIGRVLKQLNVSGVRKEIDLSIWLILYERTHRSSSAKLKRGLFKSSLVLGSSSMLLIYISTPFSVLDLSHSPPALFYISVLSVWDVRSVYCYEGFFSFEQHFLQVNESSSLTLRLSP